MIQFCKILIVDDEFIIRKGIKHLLDWEKYGYQIVGEAENGKEALKMVKEEKPDIVLTDIVMPVMNGIEFTKEALMHNKDLKVVILSGYDDFDYVKSAFVYGAVDYILKMALNPSGLLSVLDKISKKTAEPVKNIVGFHYSMENTLVQYIIGLKENIEDEQIKKQFNLPCYRLLGINKSYCGDASVVNSFMNNGIFSMLGSYHPYPINMSDDIIFVLLNYSFTEEATLANSVKVAIEEISKLKSSLFFVLSDVFYDLRDIKRIYNYGFSKITEKRFYYKNTSLIHAKQVPSYPSPPKFDLDRFKSFVNQGEIKQAAEIYKDYIIESIDTYHVDEDKIKSFAETNFYYLIGEFKHLSISPEIINKLNASFVNQIKNCEYAEDLLTNFSYFYETFIATINDYYLKLNNNKTVDISDIIDYIKSHYSENITLQQIAKKFNFSYYYLSSYFSSHCNEGFNEFLNRIRIEQSLSFLKAQEIPISKVSSMVGYSDHSYFCKVFKKFIGVTPSKYRKNQSSYCA